MGTTKKKLPSPVEYWASLLGQARNKCKTSKELATKLGVSQVHVSDLLSGKKFPSFLIMSKVYDSLEPVQDQYKDSMKENTSNDLEYVAGVPSGLIGPKDWDGEKYIF